MGMVSCTEDFTDWGNPQTNSQKEAVAFGNGSVAPVDVINLADVNTEKLVRTVEEIPMERILLETDCPYMAPEPHRGTRNDSRNIPYVIEKIAQIKGIDPKVVEETARENAFRLFTKAV